MKQNNKGFFLAETIVMLALVTTVMAFVYPNLAKLYENHVNLVKFYDQPQDLYILRYFYNENVYKNQIDSKTEDGCKTISKLESIGTANLSDNKEPKFNTKVNLYIVSYMQTDFNNTNTNIDFNKYLHRLKRSSYDSSAYRLIGEFKYGEITRYASIKIENPYPDRKCNLGG